MPEQPVSQPVSEAQARVNAIRLRVMQEVMSEIMQEQRAEILRRATAKLKQFGIIVQGGPGEAEKLP